MIDIRYHIYSLAAVFFALAVGIVVGTSFASRSPAGDSARRTVQRYESMIPNLRQEIELATAQRIEKEGIAKESEEFCRAVMPIVVRLRLQWRNVAIIQVGDYDDLAGAIKRTLELANASVNSITVVNRGFEFDDEAEVARALQSIGANPPANAKQARDKLLTVVSDAVCYPADPHILSLAENTGLSKFTGDYVRTNRLVVLVGGLKNKPTKADEDLNSELIAQLEKRGAVVVGCEGTRAEYSQVPAWSKMGIATVDNIETTMGQISLVCALNGEKARFGTKSTAERLVPHTLETE